MRGLGVEPGPAGPPDTLARALPYIFIHSKAYSKRRCSLLTGGSADLLLLLLLFPVRAFAQGSLCPGALLALTGVMIHLGRRIFYVVKHNGICSEGSKTRQKCVIPMGSLHQNIVFYSRILGDPYGLCAPECTQ